MIPNLENRHKSKPVHSLAEIAILKSFFSGNIRQFNVYKENQIIAGTTIFLSKNVAHSQYMSKNEEDKGFGSLDFLHNYLLNTVFKDRKFFDFGISNECQGKKINEGLSYWKESFGANILTQDFYEVHTENYSKLEQIVL